MTAIKKAFFDDVRTAAGFAEETTIPSLVDLMKLRRAAAIELLCGKFKSELEYSEALELYKYLTAQVMAIVGVGYTP